MQSDRLKAGLDTPNSLKAGLLTHMNKPARFSTLPPHDGRQPVVRIYQLAQPAIQYLTALVEAADGIGLVRTLDETRGIIECWLMPDFIDTYDTILAAVGREWPIQPLGPEFE